MIVDIHSRSNPRLLDLVKHREERYFFEGDKLVRDLLARRVVPDLLIAAGEAAAGLPLQAAREIWRVTPTVMEKVSGLRQPPSLIAVVEEWPERVELGREPLVFGLDGVQDPGNLGSIFRCAAAFGVGALALAGSCARPRNPKVVRAAQTALLDVRFQHFPDAVTLAQRARAAGLQVYVTAARPGGREVEPTEVRRPCLVLLGSEGQGLAPRLLEQFPRLRIDQDPRVESLNVAVAACLLMHELRRAASRA